MIESTAPEFDLALSEARIRAALDGVITIDADGVVVEWNPAAERIFGYSRREAVGRSMGELIVPPELQDQHRAGMRRYLDTRVGRVLDQRLEMPAVTAEGRAITIELTITSFVARDETWFTGWVRDITDIKATEEKLAQSEERFRAIVEHSSDVITILDGEGNWLYTSDAGTRLTGYEKGFDPEGGIFSLLHPDDFELAAVTLREVLSGERGPDDPVELRIVAADGSVLYFETVGVNMLADPAVHGVVLHARDVTERRRAEEELRIRTTQLAAVLGSIRLGVLVEDATRHVAVANEAFAELFGSPVEPAAMVGADCAVLSGQVKGLFADPDGFVKGIDRCLDGRTIVSEEIPLADGRVLEREYVPLLDDEGSVDGHVWLYRDITDRTRAARERERLLEAERLARRSIEESQAALEIQNRSLRELDRLKDEVVATVSHELRTPLTSIISFSELLEDGHAGSLTGEQGEFVGTIRRNADRLIRVVNDLLLIARLESETITLERESTDLAELAVTLVAARRPAADEKRIELTVEGEGVAFVDPVRIEQVIDNLVSNAVKFTPAGGEVTVRVGVENGSARIEVVDTGIGIPAADRDRLFERFFRAGNARALTIAGTGLGLSVCHAIVRLHGGQIDVESAEGKGTTFRMILPETVPEERDG